jgi:proteic killer suppression protein
VILSFKDDEAQKIFSRQWSAKLPRDMQGAAYRKLALLHSANALLDLQSPPGNRLEKLRGDRVGQYSIRINERWRICFEWQGKDAINVEIVDYHG